MTQLHERVPLAQVRNLMVPGEPLPFRVLDGQGRLLLAAGQRVMNAEQLKLLLERGACVEYNEVEAVRQTRAGAAAGAGGLTPSNRKRTLFDRWEQQTWALDALTRQLGRDKGVASQFEAFADEHIELIDRHPDAALFVAVRQDDRRFALYALTHGLHTATVLVLCTRVLGWTPERVRRAALVALTMNASIGELQAQMAEQVDPATKRQMDQIRSHPARSAELLRASGVSDAEWISGVEDHHEQTGGAGYPRALQVVTELASVVRAADVFMAKISPRAMRAPLVPQAAARQLFQEQGGGPIAAALIKAIGVYPPGDFVRLRNGELGIVVQRAGAGRATVVLALAAASGKPVPGSPRRDTADPEFAITGPVAERAGLPRVLPEQVYGLIDL